MQIPLKITFRNLDRSAALEADITSHADKLETYYSKHHRVPRRARDAAQTPIGTGNITTSASMSPFRQHADSRPRAG